SDRRLRPPRSAGRPGGRSRSPCSRDRVYGECRLQGPSRPAVAAARERLLGSRDWRLPMRRDLVDILACPLCHEPLTLHVEREEDGEVLEGHLECTSCHERYPIVEG